MGLYAKIVKADWRLQSKQVFEKGFPQPANLERPWIRGWGFFIQSQQDLITCLLTLPRY